MTIVIAMLIHCHFVLLVLRLTLLYKDIFTKKRLWWKLRRIYSFVTINSEQICWRPDYSTKQDLYALYRKARDAKI